MTGAELRHYVEHSGKPVWLKLSYGGWYWTIPWTDKEEILKLAELLDENQKCGYGPPEDSVVNIDRCDETGDLLIAAILE